MELFYSFANYCWQSIALTALLYIALHYQAGISLTVITIIGFSITGFYNIAVFPALLSPLRRFPRVRLHDIRYLFPVTDVPRGDFALQWAKKHSKDDALRIDIGLQTCLMPLSPVALRDVLSTKQADYEKPLTGSNYLSRILGYGLILSEGSRHTRQRKALTSSFRIQNIRSLHPLMLAKTNIMIEMMEKEVSRTGKCEINSWASKVTLDIIGNSLMSQEFDSLRTQSQAVNEAFSELTAVNPGQTFLFLLGTMLPKAVVAALPTKTNRMIDRNCRIIRKACEESLAARDSATTRAEVGSEILTSILKDTQADQQEIVDQMLTFLGAGHETTATSVAWATHLLTLPQNFRYQTELRREIEANPDSISSATALESLPWLNAICEETLRLYPPVTTTARKAVRETTIAGTLVPKGTMVFLFPWAINRHPEYWGGADAERFLPERWLDTHDNGQTRCNKHGGAESNYCELTFLHGNRACIGKDFSKAEWRCILAIMFGKFRVRRLPGDNLEANPVGSLTIKPEGGLYVHLERIHEQ